MSTINPEGMVSDLTTLSDGRSSARLADFLRGRRASIVKEWTEFARTRTPASDGMSKLALEDHIHDILENIATDIETGQTAKEQFDKSRGNGPVDGSFQQSAAEVHSALRLADGFDIDQMVSEYRALRASVVKHWVADNPILAATDIDDLTRFNEAIDQAVTESVAHYTKTINDSRNMFLGVLGHDLRNPIGAASMAAQWMVRSGLSDAKQAKVATDIVRTTERATRILNDLLDLTRSAFGTEVHVVKAEMDLAVLCHELADELRSISRDCDIVVESDGNTAGLWDKSRMGQVVSNLMANALQHGDPSQPVTVRLNGTDSHRLRMTVHNAGTPIAPDKIKTIFQSWMRGQTVDASGDVGTHLGLGLYIAKLIVDAHAGEISVHSEDKAGTTFSVLLPRK